MKRFGGLAALTLAGMIIMAQTHGTGETVTTNFEHAIPNIPGKSLVATVVDYAPGGASVSHEHAKSARPFNTYFLRRGSRRPVYCSVEKVMHQRPNPIHFFFQRKM